MSLFSAAVAAAVGAAAARAAYALPGRGPGPGAPAGMVTVKEHSRDVWTRTNFRGAEVTLLEGPALVAGACAGIAAAPGMDRRVRCSALTAAAGAAAFGLYDDLSGQASARGFRGHLRALARGEVTTGAVKIAGIGATGLAAAAVLGRRPVDTLLDGALIAGSANLANLFDLRPGRAAKVALAAGVPGWCGPAGGAVGAVCGAAGALLSEDLAERAMIGDTGANAMGAVLGAAAAAALPRPARLGLLGAVAGLTVAAEYVSFSTVIAENRVLRRIDALGRVRRMPSVASGVLVRSSQGRGAPGELHGSQGGPPVDR